MNNTIGLIMCTWNRIECFKKTLDMLLTQTDDDFIFYVINNNIEIIYEINYISEQYKDKIIIEIINNETNRGGFGRFEHALTLVDKHEIIVFIDDDQVFTKNMIKTFRDSYNSNAIKSRWAFRLGDRYYNRNRIILDNIDVNYCGTGGMVLSSKVFLCEELYKIPDKFLFIEDLWLSFVGNHYLNLDLKSIGNPDVFINQISDGKDQSTIDRVPLKDELLQYLRKEKGWRK